MSILVQCPNPDCKASSMVEDSISGRNVKCKRCGKPFVAKPTMDGHKGDTKKEKPASNTNPFPVLPAEFGRYRILRLLGRGGMGAVYLAQDTQLGRQVALKVPFFDAVESPQRVERFVREARSAAILQHPNICPLFDAGQIDGRPFITMAYIAGTPLENEIDPDAPMPQVRAADLVRKIALALQHAHHKGIVHRDLKPANVMMAASGEPVVMDFGLAKRVIDVDPNEVKLTCDGGLLGTPSYMAPEQVQGDSAAIGPATDVYALGVILFEMLTGRTPYAGGITVVIGQILAAPAPPVKEFRPDVDSRLDAICRKAMAKEPADRFKSMAELAEALGQYLKAPSVSPPVAAVVKAPPPGVAVRTAYNDLEVAPRSIAVVRKAKKRRVKAKKRRVAKTPPLWKKWPILAGAAAGLLLAGLLILWAVGVFKVKTPDGILVVQVNVPNAEVFVDGDRTTVSWKDGGTKAEIHVKPGTRKVELKKDGFRVYGQEVTLEDHGRTVLVARLDPSQSTTPTQVVPAPSVDASLGSPHPTPGDPPPAPREVVGVRPQPLDCMWLNGASAAVVRRTQERWAKYLGREVEATVEIANGVTMTFVLVPPGTFWMGSPTDQKGRYQNETLHTVTLTEPFDLCKYDVTQAQYKALTGKDPSLFKGGERPVECVTWGEADAFGRDLTKKRSDNHLYRLPTEAEWEYSCRGGRPDFEPFGIGDNRSLTSRDANFNNDLKGTCKVGSYVANALGLYDMHGNVWEWCADWNEPYPTEAVINPFRAFGGPYRVARGGCWNEPAKECRSALRQGSPEGRRDGYMGFRLARSVPSAGK